MLKSYSRLRSTKQMAFISPNLRMGPFLISFCQKRHALSFWAFLPKYRFNQNKLSGVKHTYVLNEFLTANRSQVCSPHLYASFGTFFVQIVQLFAAQFLDIKKNSKINNIFLRSQRSALSTFKHTTSKIRCAWNNCLIQAQKVPKET